MLAWVAKMTRFIHLVFWVCIMHIICLHVYCRYSQDKLNRYFCFVSQLINFQSQKLENVLTASLMCLLGTELCGAPTV